ncbi:hypothetical protein P280DRAFT_458952 [Massarina eburnea CBS 473.64]|uniref:DNA-directed RNA polymerase I subunit RPA43 n=1 Tax=Massarina eburnea CBS 473.64 TaxID=1395130 RepID=A0A6A6RR86_9PLEO|nr:hypothetical protein P280DRAFT_458952 [Massarina eburnea CBS 473.64]
MAPMPPANDDSVFYIERISQYVSIPPAALGDPLPAVCASVYSPLLLTYFSPVKGIVLGYEDVRLSDQEPRSKSSSSSKKSKKRRHRDQQDAEEEEAEQENGTVLLQQIDEYTAPFVWASASLLVWKPRDGAWIMATLTHQSATHITLSHLNTFPVSVLADQLPKGWTWHAVQAGRMKKGWDGRVADAGGWWVDGEGGKVGAEGKEFRVRIVEWDAKGGMGKGRGGMKISGSLLGAGERGKGKGRVDAGASSTNAEVMQVDSD